MPIVALEVPLREDLSTLTQALWVEQVKHRVIETDDRQLVLVLTDNDAERVQRLYQFGAEAKDAIAESPPLYEALLAARQHPVTSGFLLASLVLFPLSVGVFSVFDEWLGYFWFAPPLGDAWGWSWLWRPWAPLLLHFSLFHLVCNAPLYWYFGHRIEARLGSAAALLLTLAIGIGSNGMQYWFSANSYFGGLSGVICGQLGVFLALGALAPQWQLNVPRAFVVAFVAGLVLMSFDLLSVFGLHVANVAHWSGLLLGVAFGFLIALTPSAWKQSDH